MLLQIFNYLPAVLPVVGIVLLVGALVLRFTRKDKLSARARGQVFFWGSVGFWAVVIGVFMILEKLVPS